MAVEIDSLELNISANGQQAAAGLNALLKKMREVQKIAEQGLGLGKVADEVKKVADSLQGIIGVDVSKIKKATKAVNSSVAEMAANVTKSVEQTNEAMGKNETAIANVKKTLKALDDGAKKGFTSIKNIFATLARSILRVAVYRAIRALIKNISEALKEGTQNAYQFSKAIGDGFATQMDEAATSFNYLKNAIGGVSTQLLQAFLPAIIQVTDYLAEFNNSLSELIAARAGQPTYLRATKSVKEYAEAVNKAKNATLAFDQLNIINNKDNSIANFFEEAAVSANASDLADTLRRKIAIITGIIGGALFAIGVVTLFMRLPNLGLALMLAGTASLTVSFAASSNAENPIERVKEAVVEVMAILGLVEIAAGAILIAKGNIPFGAGLLLAGLGTEIAIVHLAASGSATEKVQKIVGDIMGIGGALLVAMGAVFALLYGVAGLGIGYGLLMAGAKELGWASETFPTSTIVQKVKGVVDTIANYINKNIFENIKNFFTVTLPEFFSGVWKTLKENVFDKIERFFGGIGEKLSNVWGTIKEKLGLASVSVLDGNTSDISLASNYGTSFMPTASQEDIGNQAIVDSGANISGIGAVLVSALQGAFGGLNLGANGDQNVTVNVQLDGRTIATSVQKIQHENGVRIGTNGFVTA